MKNFGGFTIVIATIITLNLFALAKINSGMEITLNWRVLSQAFSLIGITLLSVSFFLAGRFRFLDKWFRGFDKVYRLHHQTGAWAFLFLLHHPIFLAIDVLPNLKLSKNYLWFSNNLSYNFGIAGLYLMVLLLMLTLLVNLPYQWWKKTHEFMGIVLLLSSIHILTVGSDISQYLPLKVWIVTLLVIAGISEIYVRFLYKYFGPKYRYKVESIIRRGDVLDFIFSPEDKPMPYAAGQFLYAKFEKLGSEVHPYSIASRSGDEKIRLGIKILGDYTLKLREIVQGDRAVFWGPYGQFHRGIKNNHNLLCIAGGIGVTPFLGLLSDEKETKRKIDLIYCIKEDSEAFFDDELIKYPENTNINYLKHQSGSLGRITVEKIHSRIGDISDRKILLCGPEQMMLSLVDQLKKRGIKNRNIYFENFNFK